MRCSGILAAGALVFGCSEPTDSKSTTNGLEEPTSESCTEQSRPLDEAQRSELTERAETSLKALGDERQARLSWTDGSETVVSLTPHQLTAEFVAAQERPLAPGQEGSLREGNCFDHVRVTTEATLHTADGRLQARMENLKLRSTDGLNFTGGLAIEADALGMSYVRQQPGARGRLRAISVSIEVGSDRFVGQVWESVSQGEVGTEAVVGQWSARESPDVP